MFSDTPPEIDKMQLELLRKQTHTERCAKMLSLTKMTFRLSYRAIERANPGLSPQEIQLKFFELHYGKDLAERVRKDLENR